ncbi:hypothetical protein EBT16_03875 [bacterium]|nr:hypothetical protein [bacterium]
MFVPLFLTFMSPLIFGVVWLAQLYKLELAWQKTQIVLDNAAIHLGRNDCEMVRALEKDRRRLWTLHQNYHRSLACSLIPATAPACSKLAEALRVLIRVKNVESFKQAQLSWQNGTRMALKEIQGEVSSARLVRVETPALTQTRCHSCAESLGWQLTSLPQTRSQLVEGSNTQISTSVSILREENGKWNYRLWAE